MDTTMNDSTLANEEKPRQVLEGIRVIDFTAMMAGPYCARWLSDLGAEVIKIESLDGDHMRTRAPVRDGYSSYFGHLNAGKRSIAIDLKRPEGIALAKKLCATADILLEAFRPGVMKRLGLGPEVVQQVNPALIYCSISGFGQHSTVSQRPAYAPVIHAASGYYMANFEYQDSAEKPANSGIPLADMVTAIFATLSIQSALLKRHATQQGSIIDINLMDSMMSLMTFEFQATQFPLPNRRPLYKPLKASDGFVIVAPVNEKNFRSLCKALDHPEWLQDPVLNTDQARYDNWAEYLRRIEAWTCQRPAEACESILMEAGVPCSRYKPIKEVVQDTQFQERQSFAHVEDDAGRYLTTNLPFSIDGQKPMARPRVPRLGEDTATVLTSILGLSEEALTELVNTHVVRLG